jgi:hypothetical protein
MYKYRLDVLPASATLNIWSEEMKENRTDTVPSLDSVPFRTYKWCALALQGRRRSFNKLAGNDVIEPIEKHVRSFANYSLPKPHVSLIGFLGYLY